MLSYSVNLRQMRVIKLGIREKMKYLFLITLLFAMPAWGQSSENVAVLLPNVDEILVEGIYDSNTQLIEIAGSVGIVGQTDLDGISLVHPSEALNSVAGVNIHRGSGQEHLTAIRSPVCLLYTSPSPRDS